LIESRTTRQFWKAFVELPPEVKAGAKGAFRLFRDNPAHPSLQFKKLEGQDDVYSARVGLNYRALGVLQGSRIIWFWIGSHPDYDRMI
jgi:hypothetical protein